MLRQIYFQKYIGLKIEFFSSVNCENITSDILKRINSKQICAQVLNTIFWEEYLDGHQRFNIVILPKNL